MHNAGTRVQVVASRAVWLVRKTSNAIAAILRYNTLALAAVCYYST